MVMPTSGKPTHVRVELTRQAAETTLILLREYNKKDSASFNQVIADLQRTLDWKPLLNWEPVEVDGDVLQNSWQALLGQPDDGVTFNLTYYPTCYRRGRWRLIVDVLHGPRHHTWGCFDEADQPMRNYHSSANAIEEAEAIAAVLWADRMERGAIGQ